MRLSLFTASALAALSLANPISNLNKRADVISLLDDLYSNIQIYTGAINATLAPLSPSSSILDKTAAIPKVGASLTSIASAIKDTTNTISALPRVNSTVTDTAEKRYLNDRAVLLVDKRQNPTVAILLSLIILEVISTIAGAIAILGLAALLIYINPVTGALAALILAVELLLDIVLGSVTILLNTLLTGLALTIGGL